jgi:hypothetical protein
MQKYHYTELILHIKITNLKKVTNFETCGHF